MTDAPSSEPDRPDQHDGQPRLSPALIATLVAIPVMVIAGFIAYAVMLNRSVPTTPIAAYPTVAEHADECGALIAKLPESFGDYAAKEVDGHTVRWAEQGDGASREPLELRCGVARPEALAPTSSLQVINAAQWFITDTEEGRGQAYVLVDRRPYVAVWVPVGAGNAPLTDISDIAAQLPQAPLDFGGN